MVPRWSKSRVFTKIRTVGGRFTAEVEPTVKVMAVVPLTPWKAAGSMVIFTRAGVTPDVAESVTPVTPFGSESVKSLGVLPRARISKVCVSTSRLHASAANSKSS